MRAKSPKPARPGNGPFFAGVFLLAASILPLAASCSKPGAPGYPKALRLTSAPSFNGASLDDSFIPMRAEGPGLEAIGFRLKLPASLGVEDLLAGKPPRAREAGGGIPLIVFLNGSGSSGVDNSLQLSPPAVLSFFLSPALGEAIILSPQCPIGASWDSNAWLDSAGPTFDPVPTKAMNTLLAIVERLEEAYPVDLRRVSIMGFSLGAFGALEAAIRSPRMFSKAVSIAGGADTKAIAKASGVSFRIYHGELDSNVSVGMARALASALKSYGFDFSYREFPGQNHDVRALALGDPGLIPWLLETGDRD